MYIVEADVSFIVISVESVKPLIEMFPVPLAWLCLC